MEVKNHVILLLDILGYKELILNSANMGKESTYLEKVHSLMVELSSYIERRNILIDKKSDTAFPLRLSRFKYCVFSDNILFFAPYDDEIDASNLYMNLLYGLSEFMLQYEKDDLFFRGAVTKGALYYDDNLHFVFGSGLVRAYVLESEKANYPRVIIDDILDPSEIVAGTVKDEKGVWYFDYLLLSYSLLCRNKENLEYFSHCLEYHQKTITDALSKYQGDSHIWEKYKWLAEYHNRFCRRMSFEKYYIK